MRTTTLGSTGPEVGVIGLGCMGMTHAYDPAGRDEATSVDVLRQAVDLGSTLIDTADVYGPYTNEELVGRALAGGYRERVVLATKVGLEMSPDKPGDHTALVRNGRPEHIRRSIDASLRRLGTDYVDLYQLHRVDPEVPVEESWGALAEAVQAGKARHIGLSEPTVEEIRRAQAVHPVASVQSELSLWTREALDEVVPYCEAQGIAFLPFSPLGRGFLTGGITSFDELPQDDFRRRLPRFQQDALKANLELVGKVRAIAGQHGASPAQVALAWVLAQGRYVVPIPGTKTPKYLVDNVGAADLVLPPAALAELDALPAAEGTRY
ncbi:aldo/keto reductase [Streptomyces chrestomyceticus]|uniref:aldo/keto reductase n=1 Tax=Streptomyces chrestomyceticus TaxID=68185 RepID=UPI0019D07248|nr:aldo/keto reductase [Streptomyces chrestomyceticus]